MTDASKKSLFKIAMLAFVTGFSGAIMPGPLLVAGIGQSFAQGYRGMIGLIVGHSILELGIVALLVLGLQRIIARPRVRGAIGLVGGLVLLWMGWDMTSHAGQLTLDLAARESTAYSWPLLLFWGAALCAANPYFTGWWATIGAGQLAYFAPKSASEYLAFYFGHQASDYVWYLFVAALIVSGRSWLNDSMYQGLILTCGIIILALGAWFVYAGGCFVANRAPITRRQPAAVDEAAK